MSDESESSRLRRLEKRIERLEQAPVYFLATGASWALLWASFGAWCQRWLG